jgi:2-(acetamidomethylene)succinate hydrolase
LKPVEGFVNVGDVKLHYLQWGHNTKTILALHGVSSLAYAWNAIGENLANEYRFIAIDQRGHGDSSKPKDGYTVREYCRDILEFINALTLKKIILLGHSMGGRNAIVFAAEHPNRVSKLIIEDYGYGIPESVYDAIEALVLSNPEDFESEQEAFRHLKARSPFYRDDAVWNRIRNAFFETGKGLRWKYDRNAVIETLKHLYIDLIPYLNAIKCPTLFIRGEHSTIFTREASIETLKINKNFEAQSVSKSTHFLQDENPEELLEKIRKFLKKES